MIFHHEFVENQYLFLHKYARDAGSPLCWYIHQYPHITISINSLQEPVVKILCSSVIISYKEIKFLPSLVSTPQL